jgi:hypothetical protein
MGAFERALARLNSIWNKDPKRVEIATITKTGSTFRIVGLRCLATDENGTTTISLETGTVNDFLDALQAKGFTTVLAATEYGTMLARGIIEQGLAQSGDSIGYHQSLLWSELKTCAWELDDQRSRIDDANRQLYLHSATGSWADEWGDLFGTYRVTGESDDAFLGRAIAEAIRPRSNNVALENILQEAYGLTCTMRDALPNVAELPPEEQAGAAGRFLLDLAIPNNLTPEEAQILIDRMKATVRKSKAAGTDFLQTVLRKLNIVNEDMTLTETIGVTITDGINETFIPGAIICGTGWVCGTPGLLCGTNEAIKEQIVVKTILVADGSIVATGLYGG